MMGNVGARLMLGLVLTGLVPPSTPAFAAPATEPPNTSSRWLRTGEAHQQRGEHAQAGEAYRQALAALSESKQRANEGARAAVLSAEAYWQAFEGDANAVHLQAAIDVLEHWLERTGPQSRASMLDDVSRMVARLRAILEPLVAADEALASGQTDANKASAHYREVLDVLARQRREWSAGAGVALRVADALVSSYDAKVRSPADIEAHVHELEAARDVLEQWKEQRPAADDSERGPALDQRLAEIEARLREAEQAQAEAARAEQAREAARAAREREAALAQAAVEPSPAADGPPKGRTLSIVLLSAGVVATAAGAALLGEGAVFMGVSQDREAAAAAEADALAQMSGVDFDRAGFDAELRAYRAEADRRNRGMLIGGSVLLAGGIATGVVGVVRLVQGRRARAATPPRRAQLLPVVSPALLQLSLSARF